MDAERRNDQIVIVSDLLGPEQLCGVLPDPTQKLCFAVTQQTGVDLSSGANGKALLQRLGLFKQEAAGVFLKFSFWSLVAARRRSLCFPCALLRVRNVPSGLFKERRRPGPTSRVQSVLI